MDNTTAGPAQKKRGMAIASLVIGILALPTFGCLLVGAAAGIVLGIVALTRAHREPETYGGGGFAIAGVVLSALSVLVGIPLSGIVAAIAIPSLLRARVSANETAALGHVRTVISAQAAYEATSGRGYGSLECLATPETCIAGYDGPSFLDPALVAAPVRSGYRRSFHPGPLLDGGAGAPAYQSYAVVLVPEAVNRTGVRSFCGDATGMVCAAQGAGIDASAGACPVGFGCEPLQ